MKENMKNMILQTGSQIIHEKGYNNTSIQEICTAAQVPKGSFYYYFNSKEDMCMEIIDFHTEFFLSVIDKNLNNINIPYIKRLKHFFDDFLGYFEGCNYKGGCPIGNLATELSDVNENLRLKLNNSIKELKSAIAGFLEEAQKYGEIPNEFDMQKMAEFIFNSWQGAVTNMKVIKSSTPLVIFDEMIFQVLLKNSY